MSGETVRVPFVTFKTRVRDASVGGDNPFRWHDVTTDDLFKGKRVVLFALPGAFTPICSERHLPGYESHYDDFRALGIDDVICLSVNDAFVMYQWAKKLGITHVYMLPDGNGEFTASLDMLVRRENMGFGMRSWRYSMYVDNGIIKKMFVEEGKCDNDTTDPFQVSDADTMLAYLREHIADT